MKLLPQTKRSPFQGLAVLTLLIAALALAACGTQGVTPAATTAPAATESGGEEAVTATPTPEATTEEATIEATTAPSASEAASPPAVDDAVASRNGMYEAPPEMTIDPSKHYYATIKTEKGDIFVQLFADVAPIAVNNFVFLAKEGFYDGTTFHRVIDGFMAQAGDPTGTGTGGPGYTFADEFSQGVVFDRPGLLAMANSGPDTNGSQFFITFAPTDWLNYRHTIFGEVVEGMDVLDKITRRDPQQNPDTLGDKIESIEIETRDESLLPTPTPLPPTPTPFAPSSLAPDDLTAGDRPLAELPVEERTGYFNSAPEVVIDTSRRYTATVSTSQGDLVFQLFDDEAPQAVNNFVLLASLGFYDGTPINDATPGQGIIFGAPENTPSSDAGYAFSPETGIEIDWGPGALVYLPAPDPFSGEMLSNSSQVLVLSVVPPEQATAQLSFFGQLVEGSDILESLTTDDTIDSVSISVE